MRAWRKAGDTLAEAYRKAGKKKKPKDRLSERLIVCLTMDDMDKLRAEARKLGLAMGALVRKRYLRRRNEV